MESLLFTLFAIATCGAAVGVVLSQNVARMAFWLVVSLGCVAALFFMLNADFVGATQLLIYVGGTVVLLIFGVMLTASGPYNTIKANPAEMISASVVGLAFLAVVVPTVTSVDWAGNREKLSASGVRSQTGQYNQQGEGSTSRHIGGALLGVRFDQAGVPEEAAGTEAVATHTHTHDLGGSHGHSHTHPEAGSKPVESRQSSGYLLPFEIISVHLLVVLIGASYLARAKRRVETSVELS